MIYQPETNNNDNNNNNQKHQTEIIKAFQNKICTDKLIKININLLV